MSYLTLSEAADYASRAKGFTVEPATLLRAGIHGGLRIAAPFDSLMRNLTTHANEPYVGLLFLNPDDGDLFRIESFGQATIKKAYGLDGVSIYAPFVVQTLAQLRVMVSDLDKFLPLLESLDTPQTAPAQTADTVAAPLVEAPAPMPTIKKEGYVLKKAAAIAKYSATWTTIQADFNHASENGLSEAAKATNHGDWYEKALLTWADQRGKRGEPKQSREMVNSVFAIPGRKHTIEG